MTIHEFITNKLKAHLDSEEYDKVLECKTKLTDDYLARDEDFNSLSRTFIWPTNTLFDIYLNIADTVSKLIEPVFKGDLDTKELYTNYVILKDLEDRAIKRGETVPSGDNTEHLQELRIIELIIMSCNMRLLYLTLWDKEGKHKDEFRLLEEKVKIMETMLIEDSAK
ncbi:hypothetical protein D3C81_08990 [compost metagenome]